MRIRKDKILEKAKKQNYKTSPSDEDVITMIGKELLIEVGYAWIRFLLWIRKIPWGYRLKYIWERDVSQAITVWTFLIILLNLLTKNEILSLIITMFLALIILEVIRKFRRIIKKYDFLISPTYSPEEARERLKKIPLKDLTSPSVEERLEAINIKKIGER